MATQYDDLTTARQKLRPDIMVVEMTSTEQRKYANNTRGRTHKRLAPLVGNKARKVWLIEGGYCSDTRYEGKMAEKTQQHQQVVHLLTMCGYDVHLRPMPLGYSGTLYKTNLTTLTDIGISRTQAVSVIKKLHLHAIVCLQHIITARRHLEKVCRSGQR